MENSESHLNFVKFAETTIEVYGGEGEFEIELGSTSDAHLAKSAFQQLGCNVNQLLDGLRLVIDPTPIRRF